MVRCSGGAATRTRSSRHRVRSRPCTRRAAGRPPRSPPTSTPRSASTCSRSASRRRSGTRSGGASRPFQHSQRRREAMAENQNQHLVGKESPPATIRIDRARIRQFARSIGLKDPVYYDEEAAKRAGHPGLIAPPTFPVALGVDDTDPGGGEMERLKYDVRKLLHEGNEILYDRPIF